VKAKDEAKAKAEAEGEGEAKEKDKYNYLMERKMKFEEFTDMPVWQTGFDILLKVYKITKDFPS